MDKNKHIEAKKQWEEVIEEYKDRIYVIPHAYYYATIAIIEAILADSNLHSKQHSERKKLMTQSGKFSAEEIAMVDELAEKRRESGYEGLNGSRIPTLRRWHEHFKTKWQNTSKNSRK